MPEVKVQVRKSQDNKWVISMPYNEDAKQELKERFGARWNPEDKTWNIDAFDYSKEEVIRELEVHFLGEVRSV